MTSKRLVEYDCFFCDSCRTYVYDESLGDPARGIAPCTQIEKLPASWTCPVCGAGRERMRSATLLDDFAYEQEAVATTESVTAGKSAPLSGSP